MYRKDTNGLIPSFTTENIFEFGCSFEEILAKFDSLSRIGIILGK